MTQHGTIPLWCVCCVQVRGYAIIKGDNSAQVKYPTEGYSDDVAGRSFHHGCFVQQLRHKAAAQPSVTCRQAFVKQLINGEGGMAQKDAVML